MDLGYLQKLVNAAVEETERTGGTGNEYDKLVSYIDRMRAPHINADLAVANAKWQELFTDLPHDAQEIVRLLYRERNKLS